MKPLAAIPRSNKELHITNGFTIDKKYLILYLEGNGAIVINDNGHKRFITLDESRSPHLKELVDHNIISNHKIEKCSGYFEIIYE